MAESHVTLGLRQEDYPVIEASQKYLNVEDACF